jgi:two-component system OmpR family sensor kinase
VSPVRSTMASLRRQPVRIRLAIFSGALTAVILIAFAIVVGRLVSDRIEADFRDDLQGTAVGLAVALRNGSGPSGVSRDDLKQIAMANHAEIRIVDQNSNVRFQTPNASDLGPPDTTGIRQAGASVRVSSQLIGVNDLAGPLYVQYAQSRASVEATTSRLWLFLGGGVLVGTLLAVAAGMTVANRAMQPIAALTGTARRIAGTRDPSMRIPQPESDDEVAELARTLDEMLRELDAARTEAETTVKRQREFVADASHELRTPLTSILANLELLESALAEAGEDERAAARSALRSSKRMSRLVGDLLILARADAGRRDEPVECDLSVIAGEALDEVRPVAEDHRLSAEIEPGAEIQGNPDELHRLLLNLLENAVRHTPAGTRVEMRLSRHNGSARIEVSDDGPGLQEGMERQVFERFVRGAGPADRQSANGDGTGLGLSIVRAVAVAHGGEVRAGRSGSGGASFTVSLPLAGD